jgi:hypothetical protein
MINLYDAINSSYGDKDSNKKIEDKGYIKDIKLSNHNQSVYVNPNEKKMLFNVSGTHNLSDLGSDSYLALGKLKDTNRYKESDNMLKMAKEKYKGYQTSLTGHSLSGAIVNGIASKTNDKVYALNGAYTIGQKTTDNKNFHNYRVKNDIVSTFGIGKNVKLISNNDVVKHGLIGSYFAHQPRHIKKEKIFI